jgi:nucleotide-binding universal stress UspA family protein
MKYVWAFNPFDKNKKLDEKAVALVGSVLGGKEKVEAVFVASHNYPELSAAFDVPEQDRFTRYPKQLMQTAMKKLRIKTSKCTVLVEETLSLTSSVKQLAAYLDRSKTTVAIVASRAKTGLSRLVMGSFAESLVHFSPVDLLIFNENSSVNKRPPQTLLFAHDYSKSADKGLDRAIDYAKAWGCMLHVIHIPDPAYGFKFSGQEAEVENYRKGVRQKLARIEEKVKKAGVLGSVELDTRWSPVAERILKRASAVSADFVLVVAKSGKLASLLGGSVTRQVLRTSPVPVLVVKRL